MGVYAADLVQPIAEVLLRLGAEHALVVHSADGLDEITLSAPTHVCEVRGGAVTCYDLSPEVMGLPMGTLESLRVETPAEAAEAIRRVLAGDRGPRRDVVLANAAAALYVSGVARDIHDGLRRAAAAIDSGEAARVLKSLAALSHAAP